MLTAPFLVFQYVPMNEKQLLSLLLAGLSASAAQFAITAAYRLAPARIISVFDYTQVLFATLWGLLFFGEVPDALSFIGYAVIIGTAVARVLLVEHGNRKNSPESA
jgi:drug/metabolite transporter (DMT)-like permease